MKLVILSCFVFAVSLISSGSALEIKLFDAVNLTNATDVVPTTGKLANYSAYTFGAQTEDLIVNSSVSALFARQAFNTYDFTVKGYLKTSSLKKMAILSFFPLGKTTTLFNVLFSFVSSAYKKVEFQVQFLSEFNQEELSKSTAITLDKPSQNEWLFFTVRVHILEKLIRFGIDNKHFKHSGEIRDKIKNFPLNGVLRLAQSTINGNENIPEISNRFLGDLQDVAIHFGDLSCNEVPQVVPVIPVTATPKACPTQSKPVDDKCTGIDGKKYNSGEKWQEGQCVNCDCQLGKTRCMQFCKVCTHEGQYYRDGTSWDSSSCEQCRCKDGTVFCKGTTRVIKSGCVLKCSDATCKTETNGCFCPGKKVWLDGKCQDRISCPCTDAGKTYNPGYINFDGCNFCKCFDGIYSCTNLCNP